MLPCRQPSSTMAVRNGLAVRTGPGQKRSQFPSTPPRVQRPSTPSAKSRFITVCALLHDSRYRARRSAWLHNSRYVIKVMPAIHHTITPTHPHPPSNRDMEGRTGGLPIHTCQGALTWRTTILAPSGSHPNCTRCLNSHKNHGVPLVPNLSFPSLQRCPKLQAAFACLVSLRAEPFSRTRLTHPSHPPARLPLRSAPLRPAAHPPFTPHVTGNRLVTGPACRPPRASPSYRRR
ncbi:hypothetical protein N658DRAFT_281074 [Parathielavia hyrcaniae]|uniref:Uncharacterized protein n=1 Tax=Parathielavia hyrcaniae TaxID=113614 RepID=A0AAN6Q9Y0_9PEZI|nr:hypothetical protein N658DRAFT_281074 [Parathielavia hyrcaniae]